MPTRMRTDELDYHLPDDRIATRPAEPRDSAKLMVIDRASGRVEHVHVRDLPRFLLPGDLMVFNQSKVLPAWFEAVRTATGGKITGLYLASLAAGQWSLMLESRGTLRTGETITLAPDASLTLLRREGEGRWLATLHSPISTVELLDRIGRPPLPPYIRKARRTLHLPEHDDADRQRYNTVYAADPGSVAAPTAGLHFTPQLLSAIDGLGVHRAAVTLHVGLGTFMPIRTDQVEDHPIHSEWISVPAATIAALQSARRDGRRIIPVGTTTVRALESLPDPLPSSPEGHTGETKLFITPGRFTFRFADALMTNFHLPRSSLLALVAALPGVGLPNLKAWYAQAIAQEYRFYSYGDAMLLL